MEHLLTPAEAADYLRDKRGVRRTPGTLAKMRCVDEDGPIFVRVGRAIFYPTTGLDDYARRIISAPMRSTRSEVQDEVVDAHELAEA